MLAPSWGRDWRGHRLAGNAQGREGGTWRGQWRGRKVELKNPTWVSSLGGWQRGPQRRVNRDKPLTLLPVSTSWEGVRGCSFYLGGREGSWSRFQAWEGGRATLSGHCFTFLLSHSDCFMVPCDSHLDNDAAPLPGSPSDHFSKSSQWGWEMLSLFLLQGCHCVASTGMTGDWPTPARRIHSCMSLRSICGAPTMCMAIG